MRHTNYLILLLSAAVVALHFLPTSANVTAIYTFGDGFLDSGNNNDLATLCRSNHNPYGIDFPEHAATGRFSDGLLVVDILASALGVKDLLPPYLGAGITGRDLSSGVTFASTCSGIDDLTSQMSNVVSFPQQLSNFETAVRRMQKEMGKEKASKVIKEALYLISGGTHDLISNYYKVPFRRIFNLPTYFDLLLKELRIHIQGLHKMGASIMGVMGMPPVGCLPIKAMDNMFHRGACVSRFNSDADVYNQKLKSLIEELKVTLPGIKIAYVDIFSPLKDVIDNPKKYGKEATLKGCCGMLSSEMGPFCNEMLPVCKDRNKYVFWDGVHPTEAANRLITKQIQDNVLSNLLA